MRTPKLTLPVAGIAAAILLCAAALSAQETNLPGPSTAATSEPTVNQARVAIEAGDTNLAPGPTNQAQTNQPQSQERHSRGVERDAIVSIGKNAELKAQDSAEDVVVVIGSANLDGSVRQDVVVICGDVEINGNVDGDVVAVLGSVKTGPHARIGGDTVAVGGSVDAAEGTRLGNKPVQIDFGGIGLLPKPEWLRAWFIHCALKLRPLAPEVGWVWVVAGAFFLLYLLVGTLFPRPVQACVDELTRRPATTFAFGLLTKLLAPIVILLLLATGVGVVVVPFIPIALLLGAVVGKVALMEGLGLALARQFGLGALARPLAGFVLGWIVVTLFYIVPIVGLVALSVVGIWGLGGATAAAFAGLRRERPEKSNPPPSLPTPPIMGQPGDTTASQAQSGAAPGMPGPISQASQPLGQSPFPTSAAGAPISMSMVPPPAALPEALAYPRAGFWDRMAAAFLDIVLVAILVGLAGGALHSMVGGPLYALAEHLGGVTPGMIVALAYFAGMWAWKGTSVGGIVLNLKVVRLDGQPISFGVGLVRALGAAFSMVVLFLGFFWILWDRDRQGWHDRLAGTVVVRVPRPASLVCL